MVCLYFLILIPVITATRRFDGPSYRSNIVEGGKPILRMSPNADYAEIDSDEGTPTTPPPQTKHPSLVKDMGLLVSWLVENFSYDLVPRVRKNNNGVIDSDKPSLRIPFADESAIESDSDNKEEDGGDDKGSSDSEITETPLPLTEKPVQPPVESAVESSVENENSDGALRTKKKTEKTKVEEPKKSDWIKTLKDFVKDLTTKYGQHEVLERAKPVIASCEKKHKIKIKDIDVDEYGEIHITYTKKGKGKKTARMKKNSDET